MEDRLKMLHSDGNTARVRKTGLGVDFLLGAAVIRFEMDVGTGKMALGLSDESGDNNLFATWVVKKAKHRKCKQILEGVGVALSELMNHERSAPEIFYSLKRKMGNLLRKEEDEPEQLG